MSRRQILADANRARDIRRLQEQAALQTLQRGQRAAAEARQALDAHAETHAGNEMEWAAALERPLVDIGGLQLWRMTAAVSQERVRTAEQALASERQTVETHRRSWAAQSRLADAVESVAAKAARTVRRAVDEHALQTAEDLLRWRRLQP
jgi:hypothetical protein